MNNFSINIDVYLNRFNIYLLNKKYEDKKLNLTIKNDDNIIHQESFTLSLQYFYFYVIDLSILDNVSLEIYDDNLIHSERFKFKYNHGQIKMPAIRIYNPMGVGDYMMITPTMKKLHQLYNQRVSVILPNINSEHNSETNNYFREFIYSNPDLNILFDWGNFSDPDNKYELYHVFGSDWNAYYYFDLKQKCAFDCGFTLTEKELETVYYPQDYIPIENLPEKYVCINTGIRGPERSWEKEKWQDLVNKLNDDGIYVISVGRDTGEQNKPYHNLDIKLGLDLCGNPVQNNLSQTWHIINKSDIFISFDTGLYLFAGTTDTHILMLGWCGDPYYHQSYRKGSKYYKFSTVRGDCSEYCLTDPKWDLMEHGNIKTRHIAPRCELGIDFRCKPTVDQAFKEVKLILSK